jgi:hypothetical protein
MCNLDEYIKYSDEDIQFINDVPAYDKETREALRNRLVTTYGNDDSFSSVPRCLCPSPKSAINTGTICPTCKTKISSPLTDEIKPEFWIRVDKTKVNKFIHPLAMLFLTSGFQYGNGKTQSPNTYIFLRWLLSNNVILPDKLPRKIVTMVAKATSMGIKRGLENIETELPKIIDLLITSTAGSAKSADIKEFFTLHKDNLLTEVMPFPPKALFALEATPFKQYYDGVIDKALDAAFTFAKGLPRVASARDSGDIASAMCSIAEFNCDINSRTLTGKNKWLRRVCYGNRLNYTIRCVVTSEHGLHRRSTCRVPYPLLVTVLKPRILAVLEKTRTLHESKMFLIKYTTNRHIEIVKIIEDLIDNTPLTTKLSSCEYVRKNPSTGRVEILPLPSKLETISSPKGGGIPAAGTRYPSLARSSTQNIRVVGIADGETVQICVTDLVGFNMDFDGDNITMTFGMDAKTADDWQYLDQFYDIHSVANPTQIKPNVRLMDAVISTIANWVESEELVI